MYQHSVVIVSKYWNLNLTETDGNRLRWHTQPKDTTLQVSMCVFNEGEQLIATRKEYRTVTAC